MSKAPVPAPQPVAAAGHSTKHSDPSYRQYYLRVIDSQLHAADFGGLKLVVGPTGMGKTSAIPEVIAALRNRGVDKRCIYTSHRHLLIEEMADLLDEVDIPYVYLRSDGDVVTHFLEWRGKGAFLNRLEEAGIFNLTDQSRAKMEKQIDTLQRELGQLRALKKDKLHSVYQRQKDLFRERCGKFLGIFKTWLRHDGLQEETHRALMQDEGVWKLFPYVAFLHSPDRPVLLVTIHKLLYGFFNGRANERLLSLKDNIIFLDEFDMQEKEMLNFLCRSPEIQNGFEFVRLFYEEMSRQRALGHLDPDPGDSERIAKTKQRALTIIDKLQTDCKKEGFRFPDIRHFALREGEFGSDHLSVFQSSVQIVSSPFYLREQDRVWEVVERRGPHTRSARPLMRIITYTVNAILDFFSELWADDLLPQWNSWIEQCYDQKNDNVPGRYKEIISNYGFYRRPARLATETYDPAIADSLYYQGYNFFRLVRGAYHTTPDEVRIDQKKLTITPEYLLWRLMDTNLVFALSATGDIKRYVQSFDMNWLQQNGRYLPIEEVDKALVGRMKANKESKRNYEVNLTHASDLSRAHPLADVLDQLEQEQFFSREGEDAPGEDGIFYRKQALSRFLETARWVAQDSENQAHLVFMNSFTFPEKLFRSDNGLPSSFYRDIRPHLSFTGATNGQSREYRLVIDGKPCQVIFLDAAKGREMADQTFHQAQAGEPLLVVTTYATASNGVNLKWLAADADSDTAGRDLQGIHLLEAPHFYFTGPNGNDDVDWAKVFLWQVWKLYRNFQFSEKQFVVALRELNHADVNRAYKSTTDYLLNQIAVFHQALGRVDREWKPTRPVEVRLAAGKSGVLEIFTQYLNATGVVAEERIARETYTSSLILALYREVEKQTLRRAIANRLVYDSIASIEAHSRQLSEKLLDIVSRMQKGEYGDQDARQIMTLWWRIREAVLKQDYHFQDELHITHVPTGTRQRVAVNFRRDFVSETALLTPRHELFINWETQKIHRRPTADTGPYNLNRYYRQFAQNEVIAWYFRTHNYRLRYESGNENLFFTPFVQQNILAGAVGEAALKAALAHFNIALAHGLDCPPALFEVADMQMAGVPVYLDAKNYSQSTLRYRFGDSTDDSTHDKLNPVAFLSRAQKKWRYIVNHTGDPDVKLVFINMAAGENRPNEGWDTDLNPVRPYAFGDSAITVIQGVIDQDDPGQWRQDFVNWVNQVKDFYSSLEGATHA